jgi:hypothetical protein
VRRAIIGRERRNAESTKKIETIPSSRTTALFATLSPKPPKPPVNSQT